MGYTTDFEGSFELSRELTVAEMNEVKKFCAERHDRKGSWHGDKANIFGEVVLEIENSPWCQWEVAEDGKHLQWDGGEKFYEYVPWLKYLIKRFLAPWGVTLQGTVSWEGEESSDRGQILIFGDNVVRVRRGIVRVEYGPETEE